MSNRTIKNRASENYRSLTHTLFRLRKNIDFVPTATDRVAQVVSTWGLEFGLFSLIDGKGCIDSSEAVPRIGLRKAARKLGAPVFKVHGPHYHCHIARVPGWEAAVAQLELLIGCSFDE